MGGLAQARLGLIMMVPPAGLEPARLAAPMFETGTSTNSARGALSFLPAMPWQRLKGCVVWP